MKHLICTIFLFIPLSIISQPLIEVANNNYLDKNWEEARLAFKKIIKTNPYNDTYWYRYAYTSIKTNHLDEAIKSNLKAIELGFTKKLAAYNIAVSYALKDDIKNAIEWLENALQNGFNDMERLKNDTNLKILYDNIRFNEIIGKSLDAPKNRIAGWRLDLNYLSKRIKQLHKNYLHTIAKEQWEELKQNLHDSIPTMTDLEIIGSFMKFLAKISDGHTVLYPPFQGDYAFKALPLEFYMFNNNLYIRGADSKYKDLVGAKILKIGSMPTNEFINACKPYISRDNPMQLKWIMPIALSFGYIYNLVEDINNGESINFTLESIEGLSFNSTVEVGSLSRDPMSRFVPEHWFDMKNKETNLWTKDPDNYYWYEYINDKKVVYCQFNQVRDKADQSLENFSKELFDFIDSNEVEALILDIRLNNGGNSYLNQSFIHNIIRNDKINKLGKFFTIIGRRTFSAAMNFATDLENNTATLFVGEPTGSKPNFYGEDDLFVLPYSGLTGSISSKYWQGGRTSDDDRIWIAPHLVAELSAEQYRNNEDPALKAIFDYLEEK